MPTYVSSRTVWAILLLVLAVFTAGCRSEAASPTGLTISTVLSSAEAADLLFMREEEKLARDVYLDLAEFWSGQADGGTVGQVMSQIAGSEQRHMDRLKALLGEFSLSDPVDAAETRGLFANAELAALYSELTARGRVSPTEAWMVGALIEEKDIADLQTALAAVSQASIRTAYDALACGSRNHLRSMARQLTASESGYTAQILPPATVAAILSSGNERCGG